MLTDAELAAMRETAEEALPDSAIVYRKTRASDSGGGGSVSWAAQGTYDAHFAPGSGDEGTVAERLVGQLDGFVTLPSDADALEADRVAVAGTTYEVLAVLALEAWRLVTRLAVRRVK